MRRKSAVLFKRWLKRIKDDRKGVVGIESAIVLIAFVIVAAALAFVVLNMGFSTTQKAKTTITTSLGEASSAIEIAGQVTAKGNTTALKLAYYGIPLKVASGGSSIDITASKTAVKYFSKSVSYDNIFRGSLTSATYASADDAIAAAKTANLINEKPGTARGTNSTAAIIYFTAKVNNNEIIDAGEQAVLLVMFREYSGAASGVYTAGVDERPASLDQVTTELIVSGGSPLTVQRNVPTITDTVVNLG
jgi:flagellin FlaB